MSRSSLAPGPSLNSPGKAELSQVRDVMADTMERGLVEIVEIEPTLEALRQELMKDEEFHIFHFIGHGDFVEAGDGAPHGHGEGQLLFCDSAGLAQRVSGRKLGDVLYERRESLRLVVLNSCEGATGSTSDRFAGAAEALVRKGMPAVVAMQFAIPDGAAIDFAQAFYHALSMGIAVDQAVSAGRHAVSLGKFAMAWAIPVLYLSTPDGRLFDVDV